MEQNTPLVGYFAPEGKDHLVASCLQRIETVHGRLLITKGPLQDCLWAQNIWLDLSVHHISSIGQAVKLLRSKNAHWLPYKHGFHRRTALIQEQLPRVKQIPIEFFPKGGHDPRLDHPVQTPGYYSLMDAQNVVLAQTFSSPFYGEGGEPIFAEYQVGPPSRAYLKLFEALTLIGKRPSKGETCLDLGASPGGWTWVLNKLGAKVIAYDRAPLDKTLMTQGASSICYIQGDAFDAKPDNVGSVDWLFSDVICYPQKLLEFVQLWLQSKKAKNFVCTLKFQGDDQYDIIDKFRSIEGSRLIHLFHNKHELTWILIQKNSGED